MSSPTSYFPHLTLFTFYKSLLRFLSSSYGVELVCYVEAFPRPTITWIHNGIQLSTNQKYVVDNGFATIDAYIETSVRIRSLDRRTLGTYSCRQPPTQI